MLSVKQCFLYLQSCGFALICGLPTPKPPSLSALTLAFANKGDLLATLKPESHLPPKSPFAQRAALALANKGDLLATLKP